MGDSKSEYKFSRENMVMESTRSFNSLGEVTGEVESRLCPRMTQNEKFAQTGNRFSSLHHGSIHSRHRSAGNTEFRRRKLNSSTSGISLPLSIQSRLNIFKSQSS